MATVNYQGEVKIPQHLLNSLGLAPGTKVDFERQGDTLVIRAVKFVKYSRVEDGPKILDYHGPTVSLEEMDEAIGKGAEESV